MSVDNDRLCCSGGIEGIEGIAAVDSKSGSEISERRDAEAIESEVKNVELPLNQWSIALGLSKLLCPQFSDSLSGFFDAVFNAVHRYH